MERARVSGVSGELPYKRATPYGLSNRRDLRTRQLVPKIIGRFLSLPAKALPQLQVRSATTKQCSLPLRLV